MSQLQTGRPSRKEKAILAVQNDKETSRMNVILDKSFHKRIKKLAVHLNTDVSSIVKELLNEYMSKHSNEDISK